MTPICQALLDDQPAAAPRSTATRGIEVVTMADVTPIVFVVDDDVSVRESLELLIASGGWRPETFAAAQTKPFNDEVLLNAIRHALERSRTVLRE